MLAIALIAGALLGVTMGALGGGGSILTVPVLVYALHQDPQTATTASLIIVGVTAMTAAVSHARAGHVQWRTAVIVGVVGAVASVPGTAANRAVNQQILLLAFAALMIIAATAMLIRSRGSATTPASTTSAPPAGRGTPPTAENAASGSLTLTAARSTTAPAIAGRSRTRAARYAKIVAAAVVLGFLTGFLGVGGGFLIVPALVLVLGLSMPRAVGTSLAIIAVISLAAFGQRLDDVTAVPWHIVLPFLAAAMLGSLLGKRVTARMSGNTLSGIFAGLLLVVAAYVAIQAGVAL